MSFISDELHTYCELHSDKETAVLAALSRETQAKYLWSRMISGQLQGTFLKMISKMLRPSKILEIGTYTGYSALCLAEGLAEGGSLDTLEKNPELEEIIRRYIKASSLEKQIQLIIGDAIEIIPTLSNDYDLVFIDADKSNYINYYDMVFDKVRSGGVILADNVLWDGKVLHPNTNDVETKAIMAFNKHIASDNRTEKLMLPFRDGLTLIIKK